MSSKEKRFIIGLLCLVPVFLALATLARSEHCNVSLTVFSVCAIVCLAFASGLSHH